VVAVKSKASGRQTATLEVWGGAGGVIRHQQRAAGHGNRLVKRRASTAGKEQSHHVSFADTSMLTYVLAQI